MEDDRFSSTIFNAQPAVKNFPRPEERKKRVESIYSFSNCLLGADIKFFGNGGEPGEIGAA